MGLGEGKAGESLPESTQCSLLTQIGSRRGGAGERMKVDLHETRRPVGTKLPCFEAPGVAEQARSAMNRAREYVPAQLLKRRLLGGALELPPLEIAH